jgi:peptidoglycan LD-endopeptidase LytH
MVGACFGRGDAPSDKNRSSDSSAGGLAHLNGAVLDSVASRPRADAVTSNGHAANGGGAFTGRPDHSSSGVGVPPVGPTYSTAGETRGSTGSAAVAPTPDELSALAASLVVPVAGVTPAELYGSFDAPRGGGSRRHQALDIPAPRGTPIISATSGRLLRLFSSKAGGLMIYAADPTERFILMYGHLDRYADGLKDGMPLDRGQTIGYVGTTGNAPPDVPHLHFAIARSNNVARWWNGTPIDPAPLFKR